MRAFIHSFHTLTGGLRVMRPGDAAIPDTFTVQKTLLVTRMTIKRAECFDQEKLRAVWTSGRPQSPEGFSLRGLWPDTDL